MVYSALVADNVSEAAFSAKQHVGHKTIFTDAISNFSNFNNDIFGHCTYLDMRQWKTWQCNN